MQVAGIRRLSARVEMIEVGEPRPLAGDDVLLEVRAAGVASWDEFVRTGGWDVGARPPMALGVAAAGTTRQRRPPALGGGHARLARVGRERSLAWPFSGKDAALGCGCGGSGGASG